MSPSRKAQLLYGLVMLIWFVIQPIVMMIAIVPALVLFLGGSALTIAILGAVSGWLRPDTPNLEVFELAFLVTLVLAFIFWAIATFIYPRQRLATIPISTNTETTAAAAEFARDYPGITLGVTYAFAAIFFWFLIVEYYFGGSFFLQRPVSFWNTITSGLNILLENSLGKYIEGTDLNYWFAPLDAGRFRNKFIVTITQVVIVAGMLKSAVRLIKATDAQFGIVMEPENKKNKGGS
ncbi:MAG: hypothetical protein QOJ96_1774 [Alphaproteobacteria bacterium]|jgi:hypothetical protein|nr:hypothetical protein [Alphaproteobacteria bacterium]